MSDSDQIKSVRVTAAQLEMIDEIILIDARLGGLSAVRPRKPGNVLASAVQTGLEEILRRLRAERDMRDGPRRPGGVW